MFRKDVCIHYNGLVSKSCKAGVQYASVVAAREQGVSLLDKAPCFSRNGLSELCVNYCLPSVEEIEEYERCIENHLQQIIVTRKAIKEDIEATGMVRRDVAGQIPCKICKDGTVSYSCAGAYNGHIHAKCSTENCVSWIE